MQLVWKSKIRRRRSADKSPLQMQGARGKRLVLPSPEQALEQEGHRKADRGADGCCKGRLQQVGEAGAQHDADHRTARGARFHRAAVGMVLHRPHFSSLATDWLTLPATLPARNR